VADNWLTMITCGRTDLVAAVLQLCADFDHDKFQYMIYERKNAHFQEYQPSNFFDDCRRLSDVMPGKSFRFGDGDDHHVFLFHLDKPYQPAAEDLTLEILMHGVDPTAAKVFMSGPQVRGLEHHGAGVSSRRPSVRADGLFAERDSRSEVLHDSCDAAEDRLIRQLRDEFGRGRWE
jgi:S-adenosylmethionine decarboxylase